MKRVLFVFGTRPEAIKMAIPIKEFNKDINFETKVCITAQHREMLDQVLNFFDINVDYDLDLMKPNQNLHDLTASIISNLRDVLNSFVPDYVFVHGDTTTTMAASIASFYSGAKVCHIEAGLRTFNKLSPFPEEINRQITSRISDFHFAPTELSKKNLIKESINKKNIFVTGNTVIDALLYGIKILKENPPQSISKLDNLISNKEFILVTGHRRENHGQGFINICKALEKIASLNKNLLIIYPVHLNPKVKSPVNKYLSKIDNIKLIDPLPYQEFIWLIDKSKLIITDSGGVQEEAPSLGKPVLVLRDTTERPEAVKIGTVILVGTNKKNIVNETQKLIENKQLYDKMSKLHNPYGDGKSSRRILNHLKKNI